MKSFSNKKNLFLLSRVRRTDREGYLLKPSVLQNWVNWFWRSSNQLGLVSSSCFAWTETLPITSQVFCSEVAWERGLLRAWEPLGGKQGFASPASTLRCLGIRAVLKPLGLSPAPPGCVVLDQVAVWMCQISQNYVIRNLGQLHSLRSASCWLQKDRWCWPAKMLISVYFLTRMNASCAAAFCFFFFKSGIIGSCNSKFAGFIVYSIS